MITDIDLHRKTGRKLRIIRNTFLDVETIIFKLLCNLWSQFDVEITIPLIVVNTLRSGEILPKQRNVLDSDTATIRIELDELFDFSICHFVFPFWNIIDLLE